MNTTAKKKMPLPLAQAIEKLRANPNNIGVAIHLGGLFHDYGEHAAATALRNQIVAGIPHLVKNPAIDHNQLIILEMNLYNAFVKRVETEENVRACFQSWVGPFADLGRRFRDPGLPMPLQVPTAEKPWRAAFFLHTEALLGHTDALIEVLRHRPAGPPWGRPMVVVWNGVNNKLEKVCADLDVELLYLQTESGFPPEKRMERLLFMRRRFAEAGITHFVWVSGLACSQTAFAARMAPVQVMWTLKFHPYRLPEIDEYITYGGWSEDTREVHGETWKVVPLMIQQVSPQVPSETVAAERAKYARFDFLFGTLARTEKLNSPPFLDAVIRILRDNPKAGYLWTGRERVEAIQQRFEEAGVADRCAFIGWVDTPLYARVLDVFLETFPFGCGITAMQALEAGTPLLSYQAAETQYGMHFMRPLAANDAAAETIRGLLEPKDGSGPLLYPPDADAYVALANRLAGEAVFREAVGRAGQDYYRNYLTDADRMGRRFFEVLAGAKKPEEQTA